MPKYLIAYDICCPKRLARVARSLEKKAVRVQKSVFMFEGPPQALDRLLAATAKNVTDVDSLLAWSVKRHEFSTNRQIGRPLDAITDCVIIHDNQLSAHRGT